MKKVTSAVSGAIVLVLFAGLLLLFIQNSRRSSPTSSSQPLQAPIQPTAISELPVTPPALPPVQETLVAEATATRQPALMPTTIQYATMVENAQAPPNSDAPGALFSYFQLRLGSDSKPIEPPTPVQLPAGLNFNPSQVLPSPAGDYLILMQPSMPGAIPHVVNQKTGQVSAVLAEYGGGRFFGWHPDGRHFLYWVDVKQVGLRLVDAETLETTQLATHRGPIQGAAISPDGKTIAYIDDNLPAVLHALWFVSSTGGDAKPVVNIDGGAYINTEAWPPDGKHLVYNGGCEPLPRRGETPTYGSLCVLDVETHKAHALPSPNIGDHPRWSPDGRYIAATGVASDERRCEPKRPPLPPADAIVDPCICTGFSIYLADVVTGQIQELTRGITPVWSPDGSMLAFLSNRTGASEVWTVDIASRAVQQLTSDGQPKSSDSLTWLGDATPEALQATAA